MAAGSIPFDTLPPVRGLRVGTVMAGIRKAGRRDLVLFEFGEQATTAAVFTRNAFCAAPVILARRHLQAARPRALLINTGNANAGTGSTGESDARRCCASLAALLNCASETVLPFSTGVIGERLPVDRIIAALPAAVASLTPDGWPDAAWGIMTTDTQPKAVTRTFEVAGQKVTVNGIAKGAGMIRPDMATMLAFVAVDAAIEPDDLQRTLAQAVADSFNCITVDGDTSTNDACCLVATGEGPRLAPADPGWPAFQAALNETCLSLAQAIVRDGEGASKFITIRIEQARDVAEARRVADAIAHSPLVKTAFFASDPNWGRILAAIGRAGVDDLALDGVEVDLDEIGVVRAGGLASAYRETDGQRVMDRTDITITVRLARGDAAVRIWTCDLGHDYVRINAEYRT
ncbi:bifunctional glutamate N-acetyltransferase/amino-acid acetyltransferase ArgJ [Candidatus Macondimonas diazotrophica]|jgi:glutamate N-acetyltransferase/amino-acid N-acetyltransferase|uniref:Arginine biosynthesis bifunctional protein ArgJ n=1 Tax=Candidatus Macondimonas diazotrophica TaxID=2305248 RepID=A0A4Z0F9F1_9GAMM|nr:bifunctional glutamate N-acetyltransferase/amino-acid acetyltransferase ArgJ [Candidatus Macondimonas diazotrophica]NCU00207.1 bifunctional glutamate N-acetyltransferase/amino-acid acetyltransferase ArgJ [Candidatus Macondimonas diazotrophica]TFZ83004.1 bifunctional glutamate N-acetyltransferase/amino-acid acetyltransferase ArgJ [Candidatus Macondimonas diazotrophica]